MKRENTQQKCAAPVTAPLLSSHLILFLKINTHVVLLALVLTETSHEGKGNKALELKSAVLQAVISYPQ